MLRWTTLLGALLLVVMLWTSGAAHAAERFDCIVVTSESASFFEKDRGHIPDCEPGIAHHDSGCNGHHVTATANIAAVAGVFPLDHLPFVWREAGRPGRGPDNHLRPPIS